MASKGGNKKRKRTSKQSSGLKRKWRWNQLLREAKKKIKRWKRYQTDETKRSQWSKDQKPRLRSRHKNWDTRGLEKYVAKLEGYLKTKRT